MAKFEKYKSLSGKWIVRKILRSSPSGEVATKKSFNTKKSAEDWIKKQKR
jgi:hypothetical protein